MGGMEKKKNRVPEKELQKFGLFVERIFRMSLTDYSSKLFKKGILAHHANRRTHSSRATLTLPSGRRSGEAGGWSGPMAGSGPSS